MAGTMRKLKITFWILLGLFVLLQLVPAGRTNPPVRGDFAGTAEAKALLVRCCYDCHSNQTRWPWYAYVNPVAFLVVHDTDAGRRRLNFSEWAEYSAVKRSSKSGDVLDEIHAGRMPPAQYLWMHADARLAPAEIKLLEQWSDSLAGEQEPR
jgi:Haem-binding domain